MKNTKRDYARIDSPEALELAKWQTLQDMKRCSERMQKKAVRMVTPHETLSWLPADLPIVKYVTYAMAAYKPYKAVRQVLSYFRWNWKR